MSPRASLRVAIAIVACAVLVRAFPFVWWPNTHFDSDQAIVGLMAKHISEGRAWPLYFYGQNYMLAVEAYLAAPVMLMLGVSVLALKLPLVLINIAIVTLLLRLLVNEGRLSAWAALIPALPIALPAAGIAARATEAMGGNVEPWLYVLVLWWLRGRPFAFGVALGVGVLHREFTAYGAAALLAMDTLTLATHPHRIARFRERARHWSLVGITFVATRVVAASLEPFASAMGPATTIEDRAILAATQGTLAGRLCFRPETWDTRLPQLLGDHLPRLVGGKAAPLQDYGIQSVGYSGQDGLQLWVGLITIAGLASGVWQWWATRTGQREAPISHLGGYLVLVGLISTLVYGFWACTRVGVETMRYDLLGVWIPVGALVMAVQTWRQPVVRAGFAAAVTLWCLLNTLDIVALIQEYRHHPPSDRRLLLAEMLEDRGLTVARSRYGTAYHVTFLALERVRVTPTSYVRIRAYEDEANRANAPTIADEPCAGGEPLPSGQFLCAAGGPTASAR
jgi:hypothetical protein